MSQCKNMNSWYSKGIALFPAGYGKKWPNFQPRWSARIQLLLYVGPSVCGSRGGCWNFASLAATWTAPKMSRCFTLFESTYALLVKHISFCCIPYIKLQLECTAKVSWRPIFTHIYNYIYIYIFLFCFILRIQKLFKSYTQVMTCQGT